MAATVTITYKPPIAEWRKFFSDKLIEQGLREEMNSVGRQARTRVRRSLAAQTLMPYSEVSQAVQMKPAYYKNLNVEITIKDKVPTLGRFMTSYRLPPKRQRVSRLFMGGMPVGMIGSRIGFIRLRVWAGVQQFPVHSPAPFVLPGTRLIVVRTTKERRGKLKALSGPNLAGGKPSTGEVQRGPTKQYIQVELPADFAKNVEARMTRILGAASKTP
jgi:hypothetical protein